MTVALDYTPSFYIADGQTKEFQYNFSLTMTSNLVVFTMDKRGEKTVVDKGLYEFTINPDNTGGSVTFNTIPETGTNIVIARIETPTQEKDWRNTEGFDLKSLMDEFDKLTRWCQELAENNKRSIVVPENKEDDPLDLYNRMIISDELESVKFLKNENGNLYYSLDNKNWTMLPKSAMIQELRQRTVLDEHQVPHIVFEYRIGEKWYDVFSDRYHNEIGGRDEADCHPISAITQLQETLDKKVEFPDGITEVVSDITVSQTADGIELKNRYFFANGKPGATESVVFQKATATQDGLMTKEQAEDLGKKADKTEVDTALAEKADKATTYTKTEVDDKLNLKADKATTLQGYGITDAYTKAETDEAINQKVAGVYRVKGSVATYNDLPSSGQQVGDVWNVLDTGANYVWTNDLTWDKLSETVDLTPYLKKTDAASTYATLAQVGTLETDLSSHTGNTSNPHNVTKVQVGLGNVDNTSDLDKPISTATQNALNGKLSIKQNPQDAGKLVKVGSDGNLEFSSEGSGGGLQSVSHGATLKGAGTDLSPLDVADGAIGNTQLSEEVKDNIDNRTLTYIED